MKRFSTVCIAVVAALPFLQASNSALAHTHPCDDLTGWGLYIADQGLNNLQPAEEYISKIGDAEVAISQVLDSLYASGELVERGSELARLLVDLRDNPQEVRDVSEALRGIGGFVLATFLRKYLNQLGEVVRPEDGDSIHDTKLYGKIRDYILVDRTGTTGTGHISVDTCTIEAKTGNWQFFHWDIVVNEPPYSIVSGTSPDPYRPQLNRKLSARGLAIRVRNIYFQESGGPDLVRLDDNHQKYTRTASSCIDLFTEGEPPGTFGELIGSAYCLGRCADPPIVNSGD